MDLRLPTLGGAQTTALIREEFPEAKILVISSFTNDEDVYSAIKAGALGYVLKTIDLEALVEVIRTVSVGQYHIPPDVAAHLAARIPRPELTARELELLQLLVRGLRNSTIADELQISERSVKAHVGSILMKLGVSDRTAVVGVAIERGLVTLGG
jgi:DNA-binding NarL/FixJ family response regulator